MIETVGCWIVRKDGEWCATFDTMYPSFCEEYDSYEITVGSWEVEQ